MNFAEIDTTLFFWDEDSDRATKCYIQWWHTQQEIQREVLGYE